MEGAGSKSSEMEIEGSWEVEARIQVSISRRGGGSRSEER